MLGESNGESAPWMLDSLEQETITSAYAAADEPKHIWDPTICNKP